MKTSNKFTLTRIIAAPVLFVLYNLPHYAHVQVGSHAALCCVCLSVVLLAFAEFTDFLDGHFARKHNEVSDFGKMFDPFADVFLHLSLFTSFALGGYMHPILYVLILYREFSQNFLRMVSAKQGIAIAARKGGKLKTVFYVISCFAVFAQELLIYTGLSEAWNINMQVFHRVSTVLFIVCALLSYISFIDYLKNFGAVLKDAAK